MLIIVDFTALDPNIHNKNDKNSVNDPDAKRAMLKKLVSCYVTYVILVHVQPISTDFLEPRGQ